MTIPLAVLSGNPREGSKTLAAATALAEGIARAAAITAVPRTVDLAVYGGRTLDYADAELVSLREELTGARLLVVASPVYKGSYTGLLKAFLDGYGPTSLSGVLAVPMVVAASPGHAPAAEQYLRPLLHELGALTPLGSFSVLDAQLTEADAGSASIERWLSSRAALLSVLGPLAA